MGKVCKTGQELKADVAGKLRDAGKLPVGLRFNVDPEAQNSTNAIELKAIWFFLLAWLGLAVAGRS